MRSTTLRRILFLGLLGFFIFSIVMRVALTLNREIDIDEFQHLHATWMVSQHYVIYRDFWANHTPGLYYLLTPLFRFGREGSGLIVIARIIMSAMGFGVLAMTYALARIDHDRLTSFLSVLILSCMAVFAEKSIEVRPDQFLIILWLASLWIATRAYSVEQRLGFFSAGLLLGIAFLFSPKALMPYGAMSLTFLIQSCIRGSRRPFFHYLKIQSSYTLGFLIPVGACLVLLYHTGTVKAMIISTVIENFTYPNSFRPKYLLDLRHVCFFLLALAGVILHLRNLRKSSTHGRANQLVLLIPGMLLMVVFVFVQTAPYPQSVLLFAPVLAIYAAEAFRKSLDRVLTIPERLNRRFYQHAQGVLAFAAVLLAGVVIPCTIILVKGYPFSRTNREQFARMEYVLKHTRPKDDVFDGESAIVFRPDAYYYGSLFHAVVWRIQSGVIKQDIPESLIGTDCRWVIYDERVATLPERIQVFLRTNYEPSEFAGVYRAKKPLD